METLLIPKCKASGVHFLNVLDRGWVDSYVNMQPGVREMLLNKISVY